MHTQTLAGKTAIVTGASSGIGYATALALAKAGAAVVVQARRQERLDELVRLIESQGGKALAVAGDASREEDIDNLLEQATSWTRGGSKYDIVVVNAGRGLAGGILHSDESQWQEVYDVNVLGAGRLLRRAGHYLVQRKGGDIVVVGSSVGRNISPFSGFYGSSKFAVGAMAEALRREVCTAGVRVSVIMPGIVVSEFQGVAGYNAENFGKTVEQFGKLLQPQDIAEGIQFLVSLPPHVNINEMMIRPTGQPYP
ncbi:SDR family oxidoreductase [Geomonas sp. RF6]|uniref:SDR family oxidoreductase n=1 Tax=Geomonas sp. RF6 TaxID=2897342 RepID=UPI001E405784|nr:SDR family oxidoreductase [Geomonas sp. RF6]UFS70830.1 SDR family oxidoreductase [Geomonas sp. RF6]